MQRREFIALIGGKDAWLAVALLLLIGLLLVGVGSYALVRHNRATQTELKSEEDRRAAEAAANRKVEEAEKQRLATEQEREARAAAEAEAKRKSEEAEQQRMVALRAAEEEGKREEAEARTRYAALISKGNTDSKAGNYNRAIAGYNEAIRLDSNNTLAFIGRGDAYTNKGDYERALADYTEAIRLSSLITPRRSDLTPKALSPSATGASLMRTKATMTEPSPILTRRSFLNPRVRMPLGTEASYMRTKATMIEPLPILTRRSDSIPTMLAPFGIEEK